MAKGNPAVIRQQITLTAPPNHEPGKDGREPSKANLGPQIRTMPFSAEEVQEWVNLKTHVYMELPQTSQAYGLVCAYIGQQEGADKSTRFVTGPARDQDEEECENDADTGPSCSSTIGLGIFPFQWEGHHFVALHQAVGLPVGHGCGVDVYTNLVLFAPAEIKGLLTEFCRALVVANERTAVGRVNIFQWNVQGQFWATWRTVRPRSMNSVVLPSKIKSEFVGDMSEFLSAETRRWYQDHGIPHKRGYLFFGSPGSGKTSLIQAAAGHFQRNVCYLHLSHPELTDESLRNAVDQAPQRSILVLEDVDTVFGPNREKLLPDSKLSFSGLLNALDGVGGANGQMFILTTNHRERLNPALIRNGRADVHIEFGPATDEQIVRMFTRFYPDASDNIVHRFVMSIRRMLGKKEMSMAMLQHFFVLKRKCNAAEALAQVGDLAREMAVREAEGLTMSHIRSAL